MYFDNLQLHSSLINAVRAQGYVEPTAIQAQAIPHVLAGRDVLGCAQTGTGKTAAFALPILHRLMLTPKRDRLPRALVLVPTRELAAQVGESFTTYGRQSGLRTAVIFGGVGQGLQERALRAGVDILVAAPGRLLDLMGQGLVSLQAVEVLVLDEADRMLDMGFIQPIRQIVAQVPQRRQTLMFSATMPDDIRALASRLLRDPVQVAVARVASTVESIEQNVYFVPSATKVDLLLHLLEHPSAFRVVVFTRTKHGANRLAKRLVGAGVRTEVIHGNKSQGARTRALADFKRGKAQVLVATDVAARGLDVDSVSHVINYDLPDDPESYVHRIGRTGRAGASGIALSFCEPSQRPALRDIERLTKRPLRVVHDHPFGAAVARAGEARPVAQHPRWRQAPSREARAS